MRPLGKGSRAPIAGGPFPNKSAPIFGYDKLAFRLERWPAPHEIDALQVHCSFASRRPRVGKPIRGQHAPKKFLFIVVAPDAHALEFLARQGDWLLNAAEVCVDFEMPRRAAMAATDVFFESFCPRWSDSAAEMRRVGNGAYSSEPGPNRLFAAYGDRTSKFTGRPCFHVECRLRGAAACRRAGLTCVADLLNFDHRGFWAKNAQWLDIDFARLGRFHANRCAGRKRHKVKVQQFGRIEYNSDFRVGGLLMRTLGNDAGGRFSVMSFSNRYRKEYGRLPAQVFRASGIVHEAACIKSAASPAAEASM